MAELALAVDYRFCYRIEVARLNRPNRNRLAFEIQIDVSGSCVCCRCRHNMARRSNNINSLLYCFERGVRASDAGAVVACRRYAYPYLLPVNINLVVAVIRAICQSVGILQAAI